MRSTPESLESLLEFQIRSSSRVLRCLLHMIVPSLGLSYMIKSLCNVASLCGDMFMPPMSVNVFLPMTALKKIMPSSSSAQMNEPSVSLSVEHFFFFIVDGVCGANRSYMGVLW